MSEAQRAKRRGRPAITDDDRRAGARLLERRTELGMTVAEVAKAIGVNHGRYKYWERVFSLRLRQQYCADLAAVLRAPAAWIESGEGTPSIAAEIVCDTTERNRRDLANRSALGERAKGRRLALGLSREELARRAGFSPGLVLAWERALPARPNLSYLEQWESALECPSGWVTNASMAIPEKKKSELEHFRGVSTISDLIRRMGQWLAASKGARFSGRILPLDLVRQRHAEMFARRYGVSGEESSTLQAVGDQWGVTRERVRQVIEKMVARSEGVVAGSELLDSLVAAVNELLPAQVPELDQKLRPILGESLSVKSANRFAVELLGRRLLAIEDGMWPHNVAAIRPMVVNPSTHDSGLTRAIRDQALRMISTSGAANLFTVAGALSDDLQRAVSTEAVRRAVVLVVGFAWLSESEGWFWFGAGPRNHVLDVAQKILSVAIKRLDVEDIHAGLARSRRVRPEVRITVDLPLPILAKMLSATPGIRTVQRNDYILERKPPIDEALSGTELQLHSFLAEMKGMADRRSIFKRLVQRGGMTLISMQVALDQSPIIRRLDYGVYALRGWPLDARAAPKTIKAAYRNIRGGASQTHQDAEGRFRFKKIVSGYMLENRVFDLPVDVARACKEGHYRVDGNGSSISIKRTPGGVGRISRFIGVLRSLGVTAGSVLTVTIDPGEMAINLEVSPGAK